ncbi:VWA-like domain-containing protein [Cohnella sp. GbtcB17]|uniref:DUF2201 family putative metallopeptidase n=1 Tax=Cohnella sp. GbtcB17 TaxID=2824762 RepID=UPI001C300F61|nr:VWA-like domain-containing protein [Cohnella sp. GbtcB17]
MSKSPASQNPWDLTFREAVGEMLTHPLFSPIAQHAHFNRDKNNSCPEHGYCVVDARGVLYAHPKRHLSKEEWVFVLAHCLLHLGFGHASKPDNVDERLWQAASDAVVNKFLADLKLGRAPHDIETQLPFMFRDEYHLLEIFQSRGIPDSLSYFGTGGVNAPDILLNQNKKFRYHHREIQWAELLARGIANAVTAAVNVSAGYADSLYKTNTSQKTKAQKAKEWFVNHYPLLGALASGFKIIEDVAVCQQFQIQVAAIDVIDQEIYMNPTAGLDEAETIFVMAHELLHAALRHHQRCAGRDHELWNVACDYVINGWLVEMNVGALPRIGVLYDPKLKNLSAETIYDRLTNNIRTNRKLATLRGSGLTDMLDKGYHGFWDHREGQDLDDFCKRAIMQGLEYHQEIGRGLLPAGLVQEIRALGHPPVPWDVELAQWFDEHFPSVEKYRTYSRLSRRQSSTPDIPRPAYKNLYDAARTFAVVIDTSGSMGLQLLGQALGCIANYSLNRDVPFVRVVFCDAAAYDAGYISSEEIAGKVKIKGRGGTVLQPAIDLIENSRDFPETGPILVITDGECDRLTIRRDHAFIIPKGKSLPFPPRGPVFRIK